MRKVALTFAKALGIEVKAIVLADSADGKKSYLDLDSSKTGSTVTSLPSASQHYTGDRQATTAAAGTSYPCV